MRSSNPLLHGSYDFWLVYLSVLFAILASYAALDLAGRVTATQGALRRWWLAGGAAAMGLGIWAMHYIGMLAYRLPVPVLYDWPTVVLSLLAAIFASAVALFVASRRTMGLSRAILGSLFMGGGIAAMHYIGMAAMRLPAMCSYSPAIVALSIFLAVVISLVALSLTFYFRGETRSGDWRKPLSALLMGAAVPVMHYTGMAAATFTSTDSIQGSLAHALSITSLGTTSIIVVTFMVLGLTLLTTLVDRRFSAHALELELSVKRSRQILETSFDAFVGIDSQGRVTEWNAQSERTFGWSHAEAVGRVLTETVVTGLHRHFYDLHIQQLLASAVSRNQNARFEISLLRKDGRELPAEITVSAIRCDQTFHLAAFVRDLSLRKSAEEKFQGLLECSSEAILLFAPDGRIAAGNSPAERLFGYSRAELLNLELELLLPQRFRQAHPGHRAKFFENPKVRSMGSGMDLYALRKDGSEFPVEISLSPLHTEEGILVSTLILDITERKRVEQELRLAKEAAEAASDAKSTFLATMSHEIRTPMNGILGMTELLLESDLTAEQRENLGLVRLSAESLLSIINDILDFSKIEAGKMDLESIPFNLRESLAETMKSLGFRAHQKGLELVCDVLPDVPDPLLGDPGRLRQILINLVGNSIKFTEKGEILVTVEEQSHADTTTLLHFAVKDTGVGIPADKQAKVFEAFSQADGSMARKYGGTGLGLTICTKLINMMAGRIWLESVPGQGSTFHFTLQLPIQYPLSTLPVPLPPVQLRDMQVLIVDDNATNRRLIYGILTRCGMKPTAVESARAALQALELARSFGSSFPLIILDGQMPEMDGFTLAERIKNMPELADSNIMLLTSAGHLGDAARCRELGISAYLLKPISQAELLQAIASVLNLPAQEKAPLVTRHSLRELSKRSRVLLAEDNAVNQTLAVRLLERRGFIVATAHNGRETLALLEIEHFDLVLMDVQMPEMGGFEATTLIREKEKSTGLHIPIIAMTANALKGDKERCLEVGMDAYVSKPIHTTALFAAIEAALERSASPSPVPALKEKEFIRP